MRAIGIVGVTLLICFAIVSMATNAAPHPSPELALAAGRIAYMSDVNGRSWDIYGLDAGGQSSVSLVGSPGQNAYPALSWDGARLAFVSDAAGSSQIYVKDLAAGGRTRLTDTPGYKSDPAWSPDGRRIAFVASVDGGTDVFVVGADGAGPANLTRLSHAYAERPSWSPDGARLAFAAIAATGPDYEIYTMNSDGSDLVNLTNCPDNDRLPAWSPDGRRIAFMSDRNGFAFDIWVMDEDGAHARCLTAVNLGHSERPSWSPDGRQIVFHSYADGHGQLYVVDVDNGGSAPLLQSTANDMAPSWSR
jgi:TolB protein